MVPLSDSQLCMIDRWQRDFPIEPEPFARLAIELGLSEVTVLGMIGELVRNRVLSRVGAVVAPNTAGASTLAAIAAPPERLEDVAGIVNAEPGVNHNYQREHRFNLWFVATGPDRPSVDAALARIENKTGFCVLNLPLQTAYHIDLGFPLGGPGHSRNSTIRQAPRVVAPVAEEDRDLLHAIEDGLPVVSRPYAEIARRTGSSEEAVIARLGKLVAEGIVRRFGLIVRHQELGFTANAMVVWDVADASVDRVGELFAGRPFVTLCYRRERRLPDWPYNLFCMIHGRDRSAVLGQIEELKTLVSDEAPPMDVLFSTRRFKQRGARLSAA